MIFWPLVFHILIFLFLKTKLHRDLLVEWTQTYIMWEQIGSICELKRLQRKGPYEEKNWQFVVKWNTDCAIYFVYTDLCWLSPQIDWLSDLESNCSQVPDLEPDLPSWIPRNVPTKAHHSQSKPSALLISLFAPQSQCFSWSWDLVVEVVGDGSNSRAHKAKALDTRKFHNSLQFISVCQIDKFGRRKRLAIGQIWKGSFLDYYYMNLEIVTVYLRDITHPSQSL